MAFRRARLERLSVRALSWIGAQCLRYYCAHRRLDDDRIWEFCRYIEELATTEDVPAWDERGRVLEVSGLGDPLPTELQGDGDLVRIVQNVHEISASQIYGAWQPAEASDYLRAAAALAGYPLDQMVSLPTFEAHEPGRHGWGEPIHETIRDAWREAARLR